MAVFLYLFDNQVGDFCDYFRMDRETAGSSVQPLDVGSTMVSWYLHLLTATTMSTLAVSPQLKQTIFQHTKSVFFAE